MEKLWEWDVCGCGRGAVLWSVPVSAKERERGRESSLSDFTRYSGGFCLLSFLSSLILFSAFHFFFTQGENEEEQNQHMKTKTWQRWEEREWGEGEGRGNGGGTEEGEAISENKRAFKSKGWKLVRLLFLKNDPCVVLLLRARYTLFYLPEENRWGVLAPRKQLGSTFFEVAQFIVLNVICDMAYFKSFFEWNVLGS